MTIEELIEYVESLPSADRRNLVTLVAMPMERLLTLVERAAGLNDDRRRFVSAALYVARLSEALNLQ